MNKKLQLDPGVASAIISYGIDYENKQSGLCKRFYAAVDAALDKIKFNPKAHALLGSRSRIAIVAKFPFGLIFRIKKDHIRVLMIVPLRSDPRKWRRNSS